MNKKAENFFSFSISLIALYTSLLLFRYTLKFFTITLYTFMSMVQCTHSHIPFFSSFFLIYPLLLFLLFSFSFLFLFLSFLYFTQVHYHFDTPHVSPLHFTLLCPYFLFPYTLPSPLHYILFQLPSFLFSYYFFYS